MKTHVAELGLAALLCAASHAFAVAPAASATNSAPVPGNPRLLCPAPEFNFGEVDSEVTVEHAYELHNDGTAPLVIAAVRASCGCTTTDLKASVIPPGGTTRLTARLSLRGRQGEQNKSITVESNDPDHPIYTLVMKGTASVEVMFDPPFVSYGDVSEGDVLLRSIRMTSRTPGVKLLAVESDCPAFKALAWPKNDARGQGFDVSTAPPMEAGFQRGTIAVQTDDPKSPRQSLMVFATVRGEIIVVPREILLRRSGPDNGTRAVLIRASLVKEFKILGVDTPTPTIGVETNKYGPGMYRIELHNLTPASDLKDKSVRIRTDLPKNKEIVVPIRLAP